MEITFLGTSSAVPSRYRNNSAVALKAFGEVILFDCGEGTQRQLVFSKISPMKIDKIFLSHLHGDHILGIPGLVQSMGFRGRTKPLDIYTPLVAQSLNDSISLSGYCPTRFPVTIHKIDEGTIIDNELYTVKAMRTDHNLVNFSYSIQEKKKPRFLRDKAIELGVEEGPDFGKLHNGEEVEIGDRIVKPEQVLGKERPGLKIVYSGDTRPCESMVEFAKDSNLLIHESTYSSEDETRAHENFHSTSKQAATIAKEANVEKLVLTHISSRYTQIDDLKEEAIDVFENTEVANDLMKIKLDSLC